MMNRRLLLPSLLVTGLTAGWWLRGWFNRTADPYARYGTGPTIEQVQPLATLVTTRVEVADVLETRLDGVTGGETVAMLVKGDFLVGTNLSEARFEKVDPVARTAVLLLAPPVVTSPRLDHERSRLYAVTDDGLWLITPDRARSTARLIAKAYADAQRLIADAGERPRMLTRAREHAESVLGGFFDVTGWKITIRWSGGERDYRSSDPCP